MTSRNLLHTYSSFLVEYLMAHIFLNRVYHEDTDFVGVVYYANYFKFIERARSESLREVGICQTDLKIKSDISFVVSKGRGTFYQKVQNMMIC